MTTTVRITNAEGGSHDVQVCDDNGVVVTLKPGQASVQHVWADRPLTIAEVPLPAEDEEAPAETTEKPAARERRRNVEKDA